MTTEIRNAGRRRLIATAGMAALGWAARPRTALAGLAVSPNKSAHPNHILVTVFLRGGADGLSLVAPYGDDWYYRSRPTLALPSSGRGGLLKLDGRFGLHPSLAALKPLYDAGQMAIVHACGSGDQTRSHFEAMATMERGINRDAGPASGWIARHLESAPWQNDSPLRAIALGSLLPDSLRGAPTATALTSVNDLRLQTDLPLGADGFSRQLRSLYGGGDPLGAAGREAVALLKKLETLPDAGQSPRSGAGYPADDLGQGLRQAALLIKSDSGVEVACLDHGGYDTHVAQGNTTGQLASRLDSLGRSLAAFARDLGDVLWARTTVVVLSEFGRRVEENSGAGTDHGRAGVTFILGGQGVAGGKVYGQWPGLSPEALDGPGDLKVTTDYRNVLGEILTGRVGNPNVSDVFPGLSFAPVGVMV